MHRTIVDDRWTRASRLDGGADDRRRSDGKTRNPKCRPGLHQGRRSCAARWRHADIPPTGESDSTPLSLFLSLSLSRSLSLSQTAQREPEDTTDIGIIRTTTWIYAPMFVSYDHRPSTDDSA
uniref:Uncharacterized protein n=1 Tax=Plectus sambesii TaxID=2011161 RepID=A0A914W628_9BILA